MPITKERIMFEKVKSVSEITDHITTLFENDPLLNDVWVQGEVSNMTQASSGHWYFTLKDNDSQLRCVMWRSATSRQSTIPKNGDALEAHGKISLYAPRGEYQLYADLIRPVGLGDLFQAFERLKAKLYNEGLFENERKRPIPAFPHKIGIVTSPTAAAFQDILNVLRRRFPLAEVILSPTQVQGVDAPPQIVSAIERLNTSTDVDIILLCRGGGSIEDLWAFNDETVARAVAASRIPIISGVGHETDFTIVDFVSDLRAPTPSAAAELATPDLEDIRQELRQVTTYLITTLQTQLENKRTALLRLMRDLQYHSPEITIRNHRQRIDDLNERMVKASYNHLKLLSIQLQSKSAALHAASPQAILSRGYALVTRTEDGKRVTSELDAQPGTGITLQLKDGELKARVEDKNIHEQYKRTLF
ncbi:MAG: exodeoxyribonuclease VII large subunit [Chloroflexi bacterium]|nr:MAG: exodeoxyribonuclease VII large subunit [Chloroflexota bacterium]